MGAQYLTSLHGAALRGGWQELPKLYAHYSCNQSAKDSGYGCGICFLAPGGSGGGPQTAGLCWYPSSGGFSITWPLGAS